MHLSGRTVLLTGAGGGIGTRIAAALVARGARVVASDTTAGALDGVTGATARLEADLRDLDAAQALVARAEQAAGPLDVLVNCAGVEYTGAFHRQPRDELEDLVRINLLAPMALIQAVLPGMLERGGGHVVNIASISGKGPSPFLTAYGSSKAGLIGLTRSLRLEYRGSGVRFSAVTPGFISEAGMYARMAAETGEEAPPTLGTSPPEHVARAVVEVIEKDRPERIVSSRPMRPFFALGELSPRAGELGIRAAGARRFLKRVGDRRGP